MMFNIEDEMFELDVMISGLESVIRRVEPLEQQIIRMTLSERHSWEFKLYNNNSYVDMSMSLYIIYILYIYEIY